MGNRVSVRIGQNQKENTEEAVFRDIFLSRRNVGFSKPRKQAQAQATLI